MCIEGPHHRHATLCDEVKAEELRKRVKYQTLQVLQDGELEGVTRTHFCFAIFPDAEEAVYVCHRSCPQSPKCSECASNDIERSVKSNTCKNIGIRGRWRKCLLLKKGVKDPRPTSDEATAQRKWVGHVNIPIFIKFLTKRNSLRNNLA